MKRLRCLLSAVGNPLRLLVLLAAVSGFGCSGHYAMTMRPLHVLAREGKTDAALTGLREQTKDSAWDPLLVALDEGALLHRSGQWAQSADALNRAIALADDRETVRVSEELLGRAPFRMARHEKQALHALQALNYLALGKLDDALVEARLTDLRQTRASREVESSRADEKFVLGNTVDEAQRTFFEQLLFGRYISGVAWELEGRLDEAFIDYHRAYVLAQGAPADAQVATGAITPDLLRLAKELERPELAELTRAAKIEAEPPLGKDGVLIVVVESGFGPELEVHQNQSYVLLPLQRSAGPGYVLANGAPYVPAPLSSLEELAMRRRYQGILIDRERSASIGINTALFASYFVLFPIAMPVIIKRAYESGIRMGQSWLMLPAEFQVARVRLPAGRHTVKLPTLNGLVDREVEIKAGKPTVVVTQAP